MTTTGGDDPSMPVAVAGRLQDVAQRGLGRIDSVVGGPARRHVLILLAAALGLSSADLATVGASATQLRQALHMTNTDLGIVAAVTGLVAAAATIPFGALVDRTNRTRLLAVGLVGWAVVMGISATATSFTFLVLVRCALGGVTAVATPAVASLIGDYFPAAERGRIWGFVLTGELVGTGFGFTVAGGLAALSWRASFAALALPALALAVLYWRLPEPARGGSAQLPAGTEDVYPQGDEAATDAVDADEQPMSDVQQEAVEGDDRPFEDLVLEEDPKEWPLWRAVRYVLRIRTNVILIVTGAAGYFFFGGVRAFGIEFVKGQYGIGQGMASMLALILGVFAIAGVLVSGHLSDRLGTKNLNSRVYVGAVALTAATLLFVPAVLVRTLVLAVFVLGAAAFFLAALNPPLDAARLDIMHPTLWGRAESVRTVLRQPAESAAPLIFGFLADHLLGGGHGGLQAAFLIMLIPLGAAVGVLLIARKYFPRDVATAGESIARTCR